MSRELTFEPFYCDNHYYESEDAFTRHVPEEMQARVVQWAEVDGRKYHVVGGKLSKAVTNPTWNTIAKPGALHKYFRGNQKKLWIFHKYFRGCIYFKFSLENTVKIKSKIMKNI